MQLEKREGKFKLKQMPLERGLHVGEWDSACYSWLDFWAWKYDYTLFYVEHEGVYRSISSAEFPNGIRGGLYLVSEDGSLVEGPRDFEKFYVPTKPEVYLQLECELPQGQRNFLKW